MNELRKILLGIGVVLFTFPSCSDKNAPDIPQEEINWVGEFTYALRSHVTEMSIILEGVTDEVVEIEQPASWLVVDLSGKTDKGEPILSVATVGEIPSDFESVEIDICLTDDKHVKVVFTEMEELIPSADNSGEYEKFNKEWWNEKSVLYKTTKIVNGFPNTVSESVDLPWNEITVSTTIPEYACFDLDAKYGWEMAFNLFAAETMVGNINYPNSYPYFGLYNKYTGILRVFYYQFGDTGTGGEFSFMVTPALSYTSKYPFYHSLQYGIPMCQTDVPLEGNPLGNGMDNNVFQQIVRPYGGQNVTLRKGWYCFDLNFSAYNHASTPFEKNDRIAFDCLTANNAEIKLAGLLNATVVGTTESKTTLSISTSKGLNYIHGMTSGGQSIDKVLSNFAKKTPLGYLMAVFNGAMTVKNYGTSMLGRRTDDYAGSAETTGTVNMTLTGDLSLEGYATSATSNNAVSVKFSPASFLLTENLGKGVWGLQETPVVYVVEDAYMGNEKREDVMFFVNNKDYGFSANDPVNKRFRAVTFFDPTSLKINLRTDLFKNIENVKMVWTYGVYPNQTNKHTEVYRSGVMKLSSAAPEIINKSKNKDKLYFANGSTFANMKYFRQVLSKQSSTVIDETTNASFYNQSGSDYSYYGAPGNNLKNTDKDFFVVDPVVMFPTTFTKGKDEENGEGRMRDFEVPDFVVGVTLTFDYELEDGTPVTAVLTERFLPDVKRISCQEMFKKRDALGKYVKEGNHQRLPDGVVIEHQCAETLLNRFFNVSDLIKKSK